MTIDGKQYDGIPRKELRWMAKQVRKSGSKRQFHLGMEQVKAALTQKKAIQAPKPLPPSKLSEWWDLLSKLLTWRLS